MSSVESTFERKPSTEDGPEISDVDDSLVEPEPQDSEPSLVPRARTRDGVSKYSTTSSVYAEHTLSNPNNDQVLYCIAAVLQAQLYDDSEHDWQDSPRHPEFDIDVQLGPELGGPSDFVLEHILNRETVDDLELRERIIAGLVPTVDTIYRFTAMLYSSAKYSAQCNIIALVYLNRLTGRNRFPLTMHNWRGVWVACIVLAQKVWDDKPLRTSSFVQLLPPVTKEQLRALEFQAFVLLDYSAQVKPSIYAKYYFELRSLFSEITANDPRFLWALKPLSIVQGMRLADRSTRVEQQFKGAVGGGVAAGAGAGASPAMAGAKPAGDEAAGEAGKAAGAARAAIGAHKTLEDATYAAPSSRYVLRL